MAKMNVNASTVIEGMVGFGVVFRNEQGEVLASAAGNSRGWWIAVVMRPKQSILVFSWREN